MYTICIVNKKTGSTCTIPKPGFIFLQKAEPLGGVAGSMNVFGTSFMFSINTSDPEQKIAELNSTIESAVRRNTLGKIFVDMFGFFVPCEDGKTVFNKDE